MSVNDVNALLIIIMQFNALFTDRGLTNMHGFSAKVRVIGDSGGSDFDPNLRGHGRLNISCFWTGHNVGFS